MAIKDSDAAVGATAAPRLLHRVYGMPGHLIRRAQQIAVAVFMESTKEYGLTPVQYATLAVAENQPGIDQRTLASMVAFDAATVGDVIQRLEQRGLLRRKNGEDRRVKCVYLTLAGEKILAGMDELVLKSQVEILKPLSDGEQVILMFLLSKLVNLKNDLSRAPLTGTLAEDAHQTMHAFLRATFTGVPDHAESAAAAAEAPRKRVVRKNRARIATRRS